MKLIQLQGKLKGKKIVFQEYELKIKKEEEHSYIVQLGIEIKKDTIGEIRPFADAFNHFKTAYTVVVSEEDIPNYKETITKIIKEELIEEKEAIEKTITALG